MDRPERSKTAMWILICCTAIWLLLLPVAFAGLIASVMTAAAPGAMAHAWTKVFIATWITLIPALLLSILLGWLAFWRRWQRVAVILGLAPLAWIGAIGALFLTWPSS